MLALLVFPGMAQEALQKENGKERLAALMGRTVRAAALKSEASTATKAVAVAKIAAASNCSQEGTPRVASATKVAARAATTMERDFLSSVVAVREE